MKNKHKIIFVKTFIIICGILSVSYLFLGITAGMELYGNSSEKLVDISNKILLIDMVLGTILMFLMWKIDIRPERTKPKKYKIVINDFNSLMQSMSIKLREENYTEFKVYQNNKYKINFSVKNKLRSQYVLALFNLDELTEEIYQEFKDNYFEEFGNHLIQNNEINPRKSLNLIYIICVNKKNKIFTNYVQRNVYQGYQRYNLPIGIDLENKTVYIATQNDGMAPNKYRKLKRMFEKYIEDIKQID